MATKDVVSNKGQESLESYWNPSPDGLLGSDVSESEPANDACPGQAFACGQVLRPAALTAGDNAYFTFSANAGDVNTFGTDADGGPILDTFIYLYNFDCSVEIATDDDSGPGLASLIRTCATYSGVYVGRIRGFSGTTTGTYKAFVTCASLGAFGDICATAGTISCGSINLSGNTVCSNNDYTLASSGCTGFTANGRDQVLGLAVYAGSMLNSDGTTDVPAAEGSKARRPRREVGGPDGVRFLGRYQVAVPVAIDRHTEVVTDSRLEPTGERVITG